MSLINIHLKSSLKKMHSAALLYPLHRLIWVLLVLHVFYVWGLLFTIEGFLGYDPAADPDFISDLEKSSVVAILLLVPIFALFEELFFRAPILLGLKYQMNVCYTYAWVGALIFAFGFSHLNNFLNTPYVHVFFTHIVSGAIFSLLFIHIYLRTQSGFRAFLGTTLYHSAFNYSLGLLSISEVYLEDVFVAWM